MSLWWRHNIYLWRHNGARRHARAKHYEYFMLETCTQTTRLYWSKNPFESLYIYLVKQFKIESSDIFQILEYFQNFYVHSIKRNLTGGFTIVFPQVPLFLKLLDFSIHLLIPAKGRFVTIKTSKDKFSFGKMYFAQKQHILHTTLDDFFWQGTDPQMGPICSEWYSQSDRRKILEPPWSVLDTVRGS